MTKDEVKYIGDGVYVEFDGYGFVLKANSHTEPTDTIYIEPELAYQFCEIFKKQFE